MTQAALEVEDLDSLIDRLEGRGVAFLQKMVLSPVCRMSVIEDSEGNAIILHELKKDRDSGVEPPGRIRVTHNPSRRSSVASSFVVPGPL